MLKTGRCENTNESPKIDETSLGGNRKAELVKVFIWKAQEGKSRGNKEDFILEP